MPDQKRQGVSSTKNGDQLSEALFTVLYKRLGFSSTEVTV